MDPHSSDGDLPEQTWGLPPIPQRRAPSESLVTTVPVPSPARASAPEGGAPEGGAPEAGSPENGAELAASKAHRRRWLGLVVIAFSQLLIVIDGTIVNVALPAMAEGLEISTADRQWVITAYTLAFGGLLLLGGRVADYLGMRRAMVIGLIGFAVASGVGGAATNLETMIAARAVQGAFGAVLAPAALALLATTFRDPAERAKAFAVFGVVAGGGSAVGLIAGGILTEYASWRWTMYINVPFALLAVAGAYLLLDEVRPDSPGRLDLVGTVLGTGGLLCIVYSFSEAERNGWTQNRTLALLGIGLSLLILFVVSQRIVPNPLLPLRVLADRTRAGSNLAILLASLSLIGAFFFLTFYMQEVLGYSPVKTGVAFLPVTVGVVLASAVISGIMPKVPPRLLMGGGLVGAAIAMIMLAGMSPDSTYGADLLFPIMLLGISLGSVFVPAFNAATYGVEPRDAGVAGAAVNTAQNVGASLGVALLSSVAASRTASWLEGRDTSPETVTEGLVEGYARASLVAGLILVAAAVLTAGLVNVRRLSAHGFGEAPLPVPAVDPPLGAGAAALPQDPVQELVRFEEVVEMDSPTPNGMQGPAEPVPSALGLGVLVRSADAAPVRAASVSLLDDAGRHVARAESDAAGRCEFAAPARGEYLVVVRAEGALPQAVTVPWPAVREVEIRLTGAARLGGTVTSSQGSAVADALVTLTDADGAVVASARTDLTGGYELVDLTVEGGTLAVFAASARPVAIPVTVPRGGRARQDVEIRGTSTVSGVAQTPQGWLIADARVSLVGPDGAEVAVTRTDGEGRYSFAEVDEGSYTVVAVGYPPASAEIAVGAGETAAPPITLAHVDEMVAVRVGDAERR